MKELVVISGKGGTGKTSIVASFAVLAQNAVLADCDVDAADLHLVLEPRIIQQSDFSGGSRARVRSADCTGCGQCVDVCRFDALGLSGPANGDAERTAQVDPIGCEGCGVCAHVCPVDAIDFKPAINGQWYLSETRCGAMVHARLGIAEENSGKLVTLVRSEASKLAKQRGLDLVVIDGSPGVGCPVIASITGSNVVLIVSEPTLSGWHDLRRVADLTHHFGIETLVAINKWDLNEDLAKQMEAQARERGLKVVGRVRYDVAVTHAQVARKSVVEHASNGAASDIRQLWDAVAGVLQSCD